MRATYVGVSNQPCPTKQQKKTLQEITVRTNQPYSWTKSYDVWSDEYPLKKTIQVMIHFWINEDWHQ